MSEDLDNLNKHDTRLREFLMTTFLVIIVYELIAKIFWNYMFISINKCDVSQKTTYLSDPDNLANAIKCMINKIINIFPEWSFSTIPGADQNLLITVYSLITTGMLIGIVYRFSKFIYKHEDIKKYINSGKRKKLFTDDFGAILLLTFFIFCIILLILYPIFGIIILLMVFKFYKDRKINKRAE